MSPVTPVHHEWWAVWAYRIVVPVVIVLIAAFGLVQHIQQNHIASRDHKVLCVYKLEKERTVANTEAFIKSHPAGIPALGLTRTLLERSIRLQKKDIKALTGLRC